MLNTTLINRKQALKVVKELDAFPKIPENYQETSAASGGLSLITFVLIGILIMSEISYYANTELQFEYLVDTNVTGKIKLNIDMTVAMKCHHIGADVLDQTGQDVFSFGQLQEESVFWELNEDEEQYRNLVREHNEYLTSEYHALQDILWTTKDLKHRAKIPKRKAHSSKHEPDACNIYGSFELNKVAGNFHITAGKSIPVIPKGHAHLAMMMDISDYNFSHRIDHFSFGDEAGGIIYPLDGSEIVTSFGYHSFQYFMQIVPTEIRTYSTYKDTYQFAVTEKNRAINHDEGSHGVPGIFVKYDLSSLLIRVTEVHKPWWQFLVRLCGIVGGIFSVSGMLNGLVSLLMDVICCRFKMGQYKRSTSDDSAAGRAPVSTTSPLLQPDVISSVVNSSSNFITSSSSSDNMTSLS
ncbi:hypothetical protein BsWGS_08075 [Bradybaena similaris]